MRTIMRMLLISLCGWCGGEPLRAALTRRRDAAQAYASGFAREYEPHVFAAVPLHAPVPVLHVLSPAPLAVPPHSAQRAAAAVKPPRSYASSIRHTPFTRPYTEPRPYSNSGQYAESRPYVESRPYAEARPYAESRPYSEVRPYESRPYISSRPYGSSRPYVEIEYEDTASSDYSRAAHKPHVRPSPPDYAVDFDSYALQVYPSSLPRVTFANPAASLEEDSAAYSSQEAAPAVLYARPSVSGGYTYRKISNKKSPPKKTPSSKEQPVVVKIHKHKIIKS